MRRILLLVLLLSTASALSGQGVPVGSLLQLRTGGQRFDARLVGTDSARIAIRVGDSTEWIDRSAIHSIDVRADGARTIAKWTGITSGVLGTLIGGLASGLCDGFDHGGPPSPRCRDALPRYLVGGAVAGAAAGIAAGALAGSLISYWKGASVDSIHADAGRDYCPDDLSVTVAAGSVVKAGGYVEHAAIGLRCDPGAETGIEGWSAQAQRGVNTLFSNSPHVLSAGIYTSRRISAPPIDFRLVAAVGYRIDAGLYPPPQFDASAGAELRMNPNRHLGLRFEIREHILDNPFLSLTTGLTYRP